MPASVRVDDKVSCGDIMAEGSSNTFAEGKAMSRKDPVDHTEGHCYLPTTIATASPNVFINMGNGGEAAVRLGDPIIPHTCPSIPDTHGGNMITGASHVFINSNSGAGAIIDNNPSFVTLGSTPPNVNPTPAPNISSADVHIYEYNDIPEEINPPPTGTTQFPMNEETDDQTPPPPNIPPLQDCSTIDALPSNFNWADSYSSFSTFATSFALSSNFTVADMCFCAVSKYSFSSSVIQYSGLTQKQILLNMCHHAKTILEPMLAAYGSYAITSGFRNKSGSSQHNKGQATDIQFYNFHGSSTTGDQYFALAQNIRDNINYDQLILEWFGRNPWIHISSNPISHRSSVLTQVASNSYTPGLKLLRRSS